MFSNILKAAKTVVSRVGNSVKEALKRAFQSVDDTIVMRMVYDINGEACAKLCAWRNGSRLIIYLTGKEGRSADFAFPPIHPNCDCTIQISR